MEHSKKHVRSVWGGEASGGLVLKRKRSEGSENVESQGGAEALGEGAQEEQERVGGRTEVREDATMDEGRAELSHMGLWEDAGGTLAEPPAKPVFDRSGKASDLEPDGADRKSVGAGSRKRAREDNVESDRTKTPRVDESPGKKACLLFDGEQGAPGVDADSSRPAPFPPNLAASFELEERAEESGSKEAAGSEEIDWARLRERKGPGEEASARDVDGAEERVEGERDGGGAIGSEREHGSQKEKVRRKLLFKRFKKFAEGVPDVGI